MGEPALIDAFTYHAWDGEQIETGARLRGLARVLAAAILEAVPAGPDRDHAVRKVREAIMYANAAISLDGGPKF